MSVPQLFTYSSTDGSSRVAMPWTLLYIYFGECILSDICLGWSCWVKGSAYPEGSFRRCRWIVFQRGCVNLYSTQHFVLCVFFVLSSFWWECSVIALIFQFVFLITEEVFQSRFSSGSWPLLWSACSRVLLIISIEYFVFFLSIWRSSLYILDLSPLPCIFCKYFPLTLACPSSLLCLF